MTHRSIAILTVVRDWTAALTTSAFVITIGVAAGWLLKIWAG